MNEKKGESRIFKVNISFLRKQNVKTFFNLINFIFYFTRYRTHCVHVRLLVHEMNKTWISWDIWWTFCSPLTMLLLRRLAIKINGPEGWAGRMGRGSQIDENNTNPNHLVTDSNPIQKETTPDDTNIIISYYLSFFSNIPR